MDNSLNEWNDQGRTIYMTNLTVEQIFEELESVLDPELGVDIVNLGLVYKVEVNKENDVTITMTMTSMGCPMAGQIVANVKETLAAAFSSAIKEIDVQIVWTPVWSKNNMSRLAKLALGVHG
jgi:metal-sulfur cluster biosynthetic enzyme